MTLLNPHSPPTLSPEDNFRLLYMGSYGKIVYERETNFNRIDKILGPIPVGKYQWDGVDYLGNMTEGAEKLVPFDVVRVYFGDPRSKPRERGRFETRRGELGDIAPRDHEIRRLCTLYGLQDGDFDRIKEMAPEVVITTAEGIEVICPATDPWGEHIYGTVEPSGDTHDLATNIEKMKAQIKMLEEQQVALAKRGDGNDGADVKVDEPPFSSRR